MALRARASANTPRSERAGAARKSAQPRHSPAPPPEPLMQRNRPQLARVFDAASGASPGEPAALMPLRGFLKFLSDAAVVPRLLAPADVAANVVSDATTGQRARDGWKISLNEFVARLCLVAELAFARRSRGGSAARQRALLEYLAPACERLYGVELDTLDLDVVSPRAQPSSVYRPSAAVLHDAESPPPPSRRAEQPEQAEVRELRRRLAAERRAKDAIALHADRTCAAMEEELARLRERSVATRQQEQALRALSPRGARGRRHGRAVLGALAVGIISRSRVNATAGWFALWFARVRESALRSVVQADRRRADTAVQEAEETLTSITLHEEQRHRRPKTAGGRLTAERHAKGGMHDNATRGQLTLAASAAKVEAEAWQRRAEDEAHARAAAEREFSKERDAMRDELAQARAAIAKEKEELRLKAEQGAQHAVAERKAREKQLQAEAEERKQKDAEAVQELAVARAAAESSHLPLVSALQAAAAELRGELRAAEGEADQNLELCDRVATLGSRRWLLWRSLSRWRSLAFICGAEAAMSHRRVLLAMLLLHQRRRAQLRRRAFQAWASWVSELFYE
jgi:hypothetical protein